MTFETENRAVRWYVSHDSGWDQRPFLVILMVLMRPSQPTAHSSGARPQGFVGRFGGEGNTNAIAEGSHHTIN